LERRIPTASPVCKDGVSLTYGQTPPSQARLARAPNWTDEVF